MPQILKFNIQMSKTKRDGDEGISVEVNSAAIWASKWREIKHISLAVAIEFSFLGWLLLLKQF